MRGTPLFVLTALLSVAGAATTNAASQQAHVTVKDVRLVDNGDDDGFADPNETVSLFLTLRNGSGVARDGIVVSLESNDPTVNCVTVPVAAFGSLAAGEAREGSVPLAFRVANVSRSSLGQDLPATFKVLIWGEDFDVPLREQSLTLELDLDVAGGAVPSTFTEGFESGTFGTFTTMTLDVGKASLILSDGYRCQYNDPDRTCGTTGSGCPPDYPCFLGFVNVADNAFDWHVHTPSSPDGGRAYLGNNSLHWGVHVGAAAMDTTRLKQLDAIRTTLPIGLGWNGVTPELSFKHQVGLADCDYVNCVGGLAADRGVVQVQVADSAGTGVGHWKKVYPYENLYDSQGVDNYTNCTFDPVDDGSTEDDYFDPTDPYRRLGPSSTCMPEFTFSRLGDISHDSIFDPGAIGHASDGPGLPGSLGPGTWVESKFSLARFRGQSIRLRFLATSIEVGTTVTMEQALAWNPTPADDGWYVDDVRVTNTLLTPATRSVDTADRSGLPACGAGCSSVSASLTATPPGTAAIGDPVLLDASASSADVCPGGLLHRFWVDGGDDGILGNFPDVLLRGWTDGATLVDAPEVTTRYGVETRCASLASCAGETRTLVTVPCPASPAPFPHPVVFEFRNSLSWGMSARVDVVRGSLGALRANGGSFDGTVEECLYDGATASEIVHSEAPPPGASWYYLVRSAPLFPCPGGFSWGTGSPHELPGAGDDRDADLASDPASCP